MDEDIRFEFVVLIDISKYYPTRKNMTILKFGH